MQDHAGLLEKTAAGREILGQRTGALDRRSRALLIMIDGRTSMADMVSRAGQLGLDASAVAQLIEGGLVQLAARAAGDRAEAAPPQPREHAPAATPAPAPAPAEAARKRSLAAARMYLMDVMARTFGTADHPLRARLVEATDRAAVELVFDAFQVLLNDTASPSLVAHIEASFRDLLPLG
ncbi:hypothetical protein [Cupriavidus basilensis]|uniref:hypothetical protein n=1 Tax=Cupriavidus basilensis TaxID=68895 RepID=UPI00075159A1|nr:hypothetical protein [Cupriavidus basilensis]